MGLLDKSFIFLPLGTKLPTKEGSMPTKKPAATAAKPDKTAAVKELLQSGAHFGHRT